MKLTRTFELGNYRKHEFILYEINRLIKENKASLNLSYIDSDYLQNFQDSDEVIQNALDYPLKRVAVKELVNGHLVFEFSLQLVTCLVFCLNKIKFKGLTLYEYENPGIFESLVVECFIVSPSANMKLINF